MNWDDFTHIVDQLDGCQQVALAGMGESLTHPRLFDAITYCKNRGCKVQLTSNALLLGKMGMIERIVRSGLDSISFSVESIKESPVLGHDNVEALHNIQSLLETRNRLGRKLPKVVLQPILFKDKVADVYDIIRWGAEQGVDRINVVRVDLRFVSNMPRPDVREEKAIFKEFHRLRKQYAIRIDCLQDQVFDGFAGWAYRMTKHLFGLDDWCYRFQDFIYVDVNGNVHPCCLDEKQVVGNLLRQTLDEIWMGKKFQYLRDNQEKFSYCQKCDFLRLKQVV